MIAQATDDYQPLSLDAAASVPLPPAQFDPSSSLNDSPPGELNIGAHLAMFHVSVCVCI